MGHEWVLYTHKPITIGEWAHANVSLRVSGLRGRAIRLLWDQVVLPWHLVQDGVDVFWGPAHRLPLLLPSRIAGVVTIHDLVWRHAGATMQPANRWVDATFMPKSVRIAKQVIADSENTKTDLLREFPFLGTRVDVIPLGYVPRQRHVFDDALGALDPDEPFFLFVGTLEPRKNLSRLIEAFASLPKFIQKKAVLVVAGGAGWGDVDVMKLVVHYGVVDRVRLIGYVSEELLPALYARALFLAMPSLYEGFGLPLLEAMAQGCPVLTSNCASMPEVAGDAGVLVDPLRVESIAEGLALMLGDDTAREKLRARTKKNALRFSWDKTAAETLATFERAAGGDD